MSSVKYHNINGTSNPTVELLKPGAKIGNIESVLITNTRDAASATITLFIQDDPSTGTTNTFKLLANVSIPVGTSLLLDNSSMFKFDKKSNAYGLYITVGSSDNVDVLINTSILI